MEGLLNAEQAATILGVSKSMVYAMATSGQIKKIRVGTCLRFRRAHLEEYIQKRTVQEREPITP